MGIPMIFKVLYDGYLSYLLLNDIQNYAYGSTNDIQGILGQVWYLIVSIPDLCTITYSYCIIVIQVFCFFNCSFKIHDEPHCHFLSKFVIGVISTKQ